MMLIKILASSSSGNCYIIEGVTESLMIEAGITIKQIKEKLNYNMSKISCCLLSHEHGDHSKAIRDIISLGKKVYASNGTFEALEIKNYFASIIKEGDTIETQEFTIKPFITQHDCTEPLGFLIKSKIEYKRIVFATDTYYLRYLFNDIDAFMIEINFCDSLLQEFVDSGNMPEPGAFRIRKSHMSLERVIRFFDALKEHGKLLHTKHIIPIHVSSRFGNVDYIQKTLQDRYGIQVHINEKEIEI